MKISICPICVVVSGSWILLSAGVAWGYLDPAIFMLPIALLMGSSVSGIAYQGEKRFLWASRNPLPWKSLVIFPGIILAYLAVINLNKGVVAIELVALLIIAKFFFIRRFPVSGKPGSTERIRSIEEQMKQCC